MSHQSRKLEPIRIGIDVGGTFTDVLLIDATSKRWHAKVRSNPDDPSQAVLNGIQKVLDLAKVDPKNVEYLLHGTTVATNAVLQRKGAKTSLIVTKGFEDLLEIGRQQRPNLYDLFVSRVQPLVPRERIIGAEERILADGTIHLSLTDQVTKATVQKAIQNTETVAICLLFAYQNPLHEKQLATQIKQFNPQLPVSISSSILPEYREYERLSTTVINAYIQPMLSQYLQRLDKALNALGIDTPVLIMQSNGGVLQSRIARQYAVRLLFSGLAGGTLGGRYTGQIMNQENIITFDMGGTSTDVALITEGRIRETSEGQIDRLPCRVPMVDVETVGAGGGSIAWIDDGGVLRVGPQSAGADPGPVAYGSGGENPTVTDANLLLGRLNPENFLGGEITLHPDLAQRSIQRLAENLALSVEKCACGIVRVVNANMERAIRVVSIQRGFDSRDFALVAFGGAGPMHAWDLAKNLGIPRVIIPNAPGLHSALGLLTTQLRCDQSQTVLESTHRPNLKRLRSTYHQLERQVRKVLHEQGIRNKTISIQRFADLRYEGQAYEISIQTPDSPITKKWITGVVNVFHHTHKQQYGFAALSAPITFVNLRVVASSEIPSLKTFQILPQTDKHPKPRNTRRVYFEEFEGFIDTLIYERSSLGYGAEIVGPAIIEQLDSTIIVPPETLGVVDRSGNLILEAIP